MSTKHVHYHHYTYSLKQSHKLPVCLLHTIIYTSPDDVILPKNQHIGEMKLLSSIDDSFKPSAVNEATSNIHSNHVDAQWM